ncbi:unnamed protein product [Microthlaspi erraticum]|uniref:FKB95-like N-terminal Kelch domain-containing protein n=1 Tax=Microthlaspi erraticum TaxID=1685480 RepID=A0A6D2IRB8_9BRAS|nr:unnamed protein product [Microthlaspi erraticum]
MKPKDFLTDKDEILHEYSLIPIHSASLSPPVPVNSTIAVGYEIYVIGGRTTRSSSVRILDCRSNTWRDAPNMLVARRSANSVLLDQKIFVMGGCGKPDNWFEVFDIKTETWSVLPCHIADLDVLFWRSIVVNAVQGKLYVVVDRKEYTYEPKSGTWEVTENSYHLVGRCVIENVMYSHNYKGYLMWYDYECRKWKEIKGLEKLRDESRVTGSIMLRMVNYGGNLVVVWSKRYREKDREIWKTEIWCAKIALEKRVGGEIWGKTEWRNTVLTVPGLCDWFSGVAVVSV